MTLSAILLGAAVCVVVAENDRPIVAIFSHPSTSSAAGCGGDCDYIAASYPKWIEAAGGRAVPVPYDASYEHLDSLFQSVNGLLFPGGGAHINDAAKYIFGLAVDANAKGDYFPVWGTCLGFEWLLQAVANDTKVLDEGFDAENITLPLTLVSGGASARLLGGDAALTKLLTTQAVTMNNHVSGIEPVHLAANAKLNQFFDVVSTNVDRRGRAFVSTMEAKSAPVYGTQWHPEKNQFEFGTYPDGSPYEVISHTADAVRASQAFADFFVAEARKNSHAFPSHTAEDAALFYNYKPTKTGPSFVQEYFFHFGKDVLNAGADPRTRHRPGPERVR